MFQLLLCFRRILSLAAITLVAIGAGCRSLSHGVPPGTPAEALLHGGPMPRELSKVSLPPYVIEPPDILVIEGIHMVPHASYALRAGDVISVRAQETVRDAPYRLRRGDLLGIEAYETLRDSPYHLRRGDVLLIRVQGTFPDAPISGSAVVESDGQVNLDAIRFTTGAGVPGERREARIHLDTLYGSVMVADRTREEAQAAIEEHLKANAELKQPIAAVFVLRKAPPDGISREFLVESDGSVNLDSRLGAALVEPSETAGWGVRGPRRYGSLPLEGLTEEEARAAIEQHVQKVLPGPQVSVAVLRMAAPERILGTFYVEPEGTVNLDAPLNAQPDTARAGLTPGTERLLNVVMRYGSVPVAGRTRDEAQRAIAEHLQEMLPSPQVTVSVFQMAGLQQISGQHLVTPDGSVTLGSFGSVLVVGRTLAEAKLAIEGHLSCDFEQPEVAVDVFAYNSKAYYVIFQGAGTGDAVYKFPVTGNETVLDAITGLGGFEYHSSKRMWIARPTPDAGNLQILPVDWEAISAQGAVATNYQLMPGDRLFIAEDKMIALDTGLAKMMAPVERTMGFATLGVNTLSRFSGNVLQGGGMRGFFGGN